MRTLADGKPRIADDLGERSRACKVTEITEPSQCCSMRLADNVPVTKVIYYASIRRLDAI